jgi:signal transduction histidine kinase
VERSRRPSRWQIVLGLCAAVSIALNIAAQFILYDANGTNEFGWLVLTASVGSTWAICALIAANSSTHRLPAILMMVGAFLWADDTLAIGIERASWAWGPMWAIQGGTDALVIWLALAFPSASLASRASRLIFAGGVALYAITFLTRLLTYNPGAWGWCDCLPNPAAVLASQSLYSVLDPIAQFGNAALAIALITTAVIRWRRGSRPWRAVNLSMGLATVLLGLIWLAFDVDYAFPIGIDSDGPLFLRSATMAAIPIIYVVGLLNIRATRARVADLILASRDGMGRVQWESLLRNALGDPTVIVLWWDQDASAYRGSSGELIHDSATPAGENTPGRLTVDSGDRPLALIIHDPALSESRELLASAAQALRLMSENERLSGELEDTLAKVIESRARIVGAGDEARKRIERDLHDGAQQLLISTAINLRIARAKADSANDESLSVVLGEASDQLDRALVELRELARGITPTLLTHGGIEAAIDELALRSPVPVSVRISGTAPRDQTNQATTYFVVAELLTNIAKHSNATVGSVELAFGDRTFLTVSDDGDGTANMNGGTGLRGVFDRVDAVGGAASIRSDPGQGTTVSIELPAMAPTGASQ